MTEDTPDISADQAPKPEPVRVGGASCPTCGGPVTPRYRPFCCRRCADVDLHRWLGEVYRVPTNEVEPPPGMVEE